MEKRERGVFQQSSIWWSLFQNPFHAIKHKTQLREVWSSSKSKPVTLTQSSNTPNPMTQPLAGKSDVCVCVSIFVCVPLKSLSLCLSVAWMCLCVYVIYSCVPQFDSVKLGAAWGSLGFPSWFGVSSSFCMSVCSLVSKRTVWSLRRCSTTVSSPQQKRKRINSKYRDCVPVFDWPLFEEWWKTVCSSGIQPEKYR